MSLKKKNKKQDVFLTDEEQEAQEPVEALSYEELTMLRRGQKKRGEDRSQLPPHDTSDRAHVIRFFKKNKTLAISAVIILLALLAGIALGIFALVSYIGSRPNTSDFWLILGDGKPITVPYEDSVRNGILYVDMKKIAEYTGMTVSGSKTKLQFTVDQKNYFRVENGSSLVMINGDRVEMEVKKYGGKKLVPATVVMTEDACYVPYDFLSRIVSEGMVFRLDTENNIITVKRRYNVYGGDLDTKTEMAILFSSNGLDILPEEKVPLTYDYSYAIDVEAYLDSITAEYLVLANKVSPLGKDYAPPVVDLTCPTDGEGQQLQADAANALYAMMLEMREAGVSDVFVTSSYRPYSYQENLYTRYVKKHMMNDGMSRAEAEAAASKYSARPGESEHQTGLCLDFSTESINGAVSEAFEETEAFAWLSENAYKYGFILRYPKDKVDLTQYDYEPWHYRFVGRQAATEIYFSGICLEEYLGGS